MRVLGGRLGSGLPIVLHVQIPEAGECVRDLGPVERRQFLEFSDLLLLKLGLLSSHSSLLRNEWMNSVQ